MGQNNTAEKSAVLFYFRIEYLGLANVISESVLDSENRLRKREDSNLRGPFGPIGFQDQRHKPLGHASLIFYFILAAIPIKIKTADILDKKAGWE